MLAAQQTSFTFTWQDIIFALKEHHVITEMDAPPAKTPNKKVIDVIITDTRLLAPDPTPAPGAADESSQLTNANPAKPPTYTPTLAYPPNEVLDPLPTTSQPVLAQRSTNIKTAPTATSKQILFIALDGSTYKGIDFIKKAYSLGTRYFIVKACYLEQPLLPAITLRSWFHKQRVAYLAVHNTLRALGYLARYKLRLLNGFKIAITGSAGKTSSKDFLTQLLSNHYHFYKTPRNFNNAIGLPLAILNIKQPYKGYIFELGMNHKGELAWLSYIVAPDLAIVTSILPAHFGNFATLQAIAAAKCEIFHYQALPASSTAPPPTAAAPPTASPSLAARGYVLYPSTIRERPYIEKQLAAHGLLALPYNPTPIQVQLTVSPSFALGACLSRQRRAKSKAKQTEKDWLSAPLTLATCSPFVAELYALGAALSKLMDLPPHFLSQTLKEHFKNAPRNEKFSPSQPPSPYTPPPSAPAHLSFLTTRTQRRLEEVLNKPKIIDDAYNANPSSMRTVIAFFAPLQAHPRVHKLIFVLGDMLELGEKQNLFHYQLAYFLDRTLLPQSHVYLLGKLMHHTYQSLRLKKKNYFNNPLSLFETLKNTLQKNDIILFKGSNGMHLQQVIYPLVHHFSAKL